MAPPKRPWFRFYTEAFTDPKIRRLSVEERWLWVVALGAARMSPVGGWLMLTESMPLEVDDLAELSGLTPAKCERGLAKMVALHLLVIDRDQGAYRVAKWEDRQFESDDTTARTQRHRSKRTLMERSINGDVAPPETETETETEADTDTTDDDDTQTASPDSPSSSSSDHPHWPLIAEAGQVAARIRVPVPRNPDAFATRAAQNILREQGHLIDRLIDARPDLDQAGLAFLLATEGAQPSIDRNRPVDVSDPAWIPADEMEVRS